MSVWKHGTYYHYNFILEGKRYRGSTEKTTKQAAEKVEREMRMRRESGYDDAARAEEREQQRKTVEQAAKDFLGKVDVLACHSRIWMRKNHPAAY